MSHGATPVLTRARTIGSSLPLSRTGRWSAGFGNTIDPFHTNVSGRSYRMCRRRLSGLIQLYARNLVTIEEDRRQLCEAAADLRAWPLDEPWMARVHGRHHDLTFWLLDEQQALLRGARSKR